MRKIYTILIILFISSVNKSFLFAQVRAIHFGKLIDGQGNVIMNAVVIVNGDRIVYEGPEKDISDPPNAEIIK